MLNQVQFYKNPDVKKRIMEYIGDARYIVGYGESQKWKGNDRAYYSTSVKNLKHLLDDGLDTFRSMLDEKSTLLVFDMEYFNIDYKGDIYLKSHDNFRKIEPIRQIIKKTFSDFGINPLEIMTGQGYHFSSKWDFDKNHEELAKIGKVEYTLDQQYIHRKDHKAVPKQAGEGYSGAFRLLQFISLEIMRRAAGAREKNNRILPVVYSDIPMGKSGIGLNGAGKEGISSDLTLYSDPVHMRDCRCPFSTHQKHKVDPDKIGVDIAKNTPVQIALPTTDKSLEDMFCMRRHFRKAAEYASDTSTKIPEQHKGWLNVLEEYNHSHLKSFHKAFDSEEHDHGDTWNSSYYAFNKDELPACISHCLYNPEPHLKKPMNLQNLIRVLDKKGWRPKHIGGFIYSIYKNMDLEKCNPEQRANFWAQLYAAPIHLGLDKKQDLNCVSQKERGYCWMPNCGHNLADYI